MRGSAAFLSMAITIVCGRWSLIGSSPISGRTDLPQRLQFDGNRAVARFGSQLQTDDHEAIARVLGLKREQVEIETMLAGRSFSRRAQPGMELAVELAAMAWAMRCSPRSRSTRAGRCRATSTATGPCASTRCRRSR